MENNFHKFSCLYCGNNPVPHGVYWYFESLNILLAPIRRPLLKFFSLFSSQSILKQLLKFAVLAGIITFQDQKNECKVERARVLWEEAEKRGIKMRELLLFGKSFDTYTAEKLEIENCLPGGKARKLEIIFSGLPRPKNVDQKALDSMDDKQELKTKFIRAGLPVPLGKSCRNFSQAKEIFKKIQKPVIVKPRSGSRGRHSTVFVSSLAELKQAYKVAKQLCFWVIVEEQLFGPVYRATLINYELCGVLRGDPPLVVGDGIRTIMELVEQKNKSAHPKVKKIAVDEKTISFLNTQLKIGTLGDEVLKFVPKINQKVFLSEKIGVGYGGSSSEDFEICHQDNKALFVKAAQITGDPIVGFDFIIPDISQSWKAQKCGFLEANSLPFINLHQNPLLGHSRNVAAKVWDLIGFV